jgi:nitrogen fixation NifU-like protein
VNTPSDSLPSADLQALYRDVVLRHNRAPSGRAPLPTADVGVVGENPLCGERLVLRWCHRHGRLDPICFEAEGSALLVASASILVERVGGRTRDEAERIGRAALDWIGGTAEESAVDLGELLALRPVRAHPNRLRAVMLPWAALQAGLEGRSRTSTELDRAGSIER